MTEDKKTIRDAKSSVSAMNRARDFPEGTDPCSRHVAMMAESLARRGAYEMLSDEPRHCAISMAATVRMLWDARAMLHGLGYRCWDGKTWTLDAARDTKEGQGND